MDTSEFSHDEYLYRHPLGVEVARDHEAVAAIVPPPAQNRYSACLEVWVLLPQDTDDLRAGIFHQDDAGDAIGLNGQTIELTHFTCCRHSHSSGPS